MDPQSAPQTPSDIAELKSKLESAQLPFDLKEKVVKQLSRLERAYNTSSAFEELERTSHYLNWIVSLPWNQSSVDTLDLHKAKEILDKHHFGLDDVKERLLEYLAVLKLNKESGKAGHLARAPIILLVGLVGTGKTTFAYSLGEALNRQVVRIPFGGMGAARDLRGQSRLHLEAEPGYVIKALARAKTNNPIILLDEIDRISDDARADVMGVLVELLDPEQNRFFIDHYIDYPFDLSQVLFLATANGTSHIATAVLDRLEPISMPSYSDEEKINIAKNYLFPKTLEATSLPQGVLTINEDVWHDIVRPLGYDSGIRTLQRTIQGIVRKVAKEYVQGQSQQVTLSLENVKHYLPSFQNELLM